MVKIFERPPKLDNDFFMFIWLMCVIFVVIIAFFITWNDLKFNMNPYVCTFFYGVLLGYFAGRVRRKGDV